MSSSHFSAEIQNMALSDEILKPHDGAMTINPSGSTESVDIVQLTPLTAKEQIRAREEALRYRAMRRVEHRERNHRLAEEACQVGDALFDQNDCVGASACYFDATNLSPSNPEFYLKLAKAYVRRELYVDAAHAATRALSFDPKSLEARFYRGLARLEQGLLPAAKIDFETVIAYDPVHVLAHSSLGRTLSLLQATKIGSHVLYPPLFEVTPDGEPVDFAFPRYEDDKLEIAEPSDSSDCNHMGNGVPCRFYNHDGCARGAECDFSHAPDEKSVRDDLGQNVCLYYLLSSCKFGDNKCIYSHSKDALPSAHGWWNDPEQIKRVKEVVEFAEKKARERRGTKGGRGHRTDAKKSRAKGPGRGKGQHSKHRERGGREKATRDGQPPVKDVVDKDAQNAEADAEKGVVGEPSADKNGSMTEDCELKAAVVEPSADSTSKSGVQVENDQESNRKVTDLESSEGTKSDGETVTGTPSG